MMIGVEDVVLITVILVVPRYGHGARVDVARLGGHGEGD